MSALPATPRDYAVFTEHGIIECRTGRHEVVTLAASAQANIFRLSKESGGLENAGGLYSAGTLSDPLAIVRAGAPGRSFKPRIDSIKFDPAELDAPGFTGFWHSHPRIADPGGDRPSVRDLECFQHLRDAGIRPIQRLVALIATPDPADPKINAWDRWDTPKLGAWIIGAGYYQRAVLEITPDPPRAKASTLTRSKGDRWLIAVRSFETTDGGETVKIAAGERIYADHPIARCNPDAFKPSTDSARHANASRVVTRVVHRRDAA